MAYAPAGLRDRILGWGGLAAVLAAALGWTLAGRLADPIEALAQLSGALRGAGREGGRPPAASGPAPLGEEARGGGGGALTREEKALADAMACLASDRDAAARALGRTGGDLARREAELRGLLDACPVGVVLADTGGRVPEANDAFLRVGGMTRDDLELGRVRWDELTPPERLPRDEAAIAEAVATGRCEPTGWRPTTPCGTRRRAPSSA